MFTLRWLGIAFKTFHNTIDEEKGRGKRDIHALSRPSPLTPDDHQVVRQRLQPHLRIVRQVERVDEDVQRFTRKPIDAFKKVIAPNGERILLHASNFRRIKRVQDVVYIFHNVCKQIPSKLLFVGDGPERATAEELSRQLRAEDG